MEQLMPYLSAFLVGLAGGVHCIGMCGGIVSALTFNLPQAHRGRIRSTMPFHLAYNLGRIGSYVAAGALMGGLGVLLVQFMPLRIAQQTLLTIAGIFMLLLGLYLGGWWTIIKQVERIGGGVWRRMEPLARQLLPVKTPADAFKVGIVWGWLPCGLVYSMLISAVATGSALKGAGLMLAFATGTLPNLLVMGTLAGAASRLTRSTAARRIAGLTIICFGCYTLSKLL